MKIDLQKLLDALSDGTDLDTLLTDEVTGAELSAIESEAIEAGKAIAGAADRTPADADKIDAIVKVAQHVRSVVAERATASAELDAKLAEKMALLEPAKEEAPKEEAPVDETPVVEAEAPAETVVAEPELVTASATPKSPKFSVAEIRNRVPAPKPAVATHQSYLYAAADVPGVPAGAAMDIAGLAASMERRLKSMGGLTGPAVKNASPTYAQVASLHRPDTEFMVDGSASDLEAIEAIANEGRLKGGSLTAAGGWCAPSEILYDLCDQGMSLDGIISLPSIRSRRGGVQWTTGPDFCDVFSAAAYFTQTEAQVQAATEKPCFEIPCPTFQEQRLDAMGFCLTGGLLTNSGYPEVIRDWVTKTVIAFAHYRNAYVIDKIYTGSTNMGLVGACGAGLGGGATGSVLGAIELEVQSFRERNRLPFTATLELKAPFWIKSVIRSDLAQRTGVDNMLNVTDAQIDSFFATRGVQVEYLYDWQPMNSSCASGSTATAWKGFVEFILYRAGTWVEVTQPIISIDARYDASLTQTNRYGVRFTEDGIAVIKRCTDSRRFQVDLCPTGATTLGQAPCACPSI